jgi:hypothetical protein
MGTERRRYAAAAAVFTVALGGAAIGGVVADAQVAAPSVTVTMKEFKLTPSAALKAGSVTIVAVNKGKLPHALAIKGTGVSMKTALVQPGKSAKLNVTLKSGTYKLWCPVGSHASLGMRLALKLGAAPAATGGGTAGATGGTGGGGAPAGGGTDGAEWG